MTLATIAGPILGLPITGSGPKEMLINFGVIMVVALLLFIAICAFVAAFRMAHRNWRIK